MLRELAREAGLGLGLGGDEGGGRGGAGAGEAEGRGEAGGGGSGSAGVAETVAEAARAAMRVGWRERRRIARKLLRSADNASPPDRFQIARLVLRLVRSSAVDRRELLQLQYEQDRAHARAPVPAPARSEGGAEEEGGSRPATGGPMAQVLGQLPPEEAAVEPLRQAGQHAARVLFLLSKESALDAEAGKAGVPGSIVATLRAAGERAGPGGAGGGRGSGAAGAKKGGSSIDPALDGGSSDPVSDALAWCTGPAAQLPSIQFRFDRACVDAEGAVYLAGALKNATNSRPNARQAHRQAAAPALAAALAASIDTFRLRRDAALGLENSGGGSSSRGSLDGLPSARRAGQLAVQVTGCLRNIALCRGAAAAFVTHGAVDALVSAAAGLRRYKEVCGNAVRALAKVADDPVVVRRMDRAPRLAGLLASVVGHMCPPVHGQRRGGRSIEDSIVDSAGEEGARPGPSTGAGSSAFSRATDQAPSPAPAVAAAAAAGLPAGGGWDSPSRSLPVLARAAFSLCEAAAKSSKVRAAVAAAGSASSSEDRADGKRVAEGKRPSTAAGGEPGAPTAVDALWAVVANAADSIEA